MRNNRSLSTFCYSLVLLIPRIVGLPSVWALTADTNLSLMVDMHGNFDGTSAQLVIPWQDNYRYLTFSQLGGSKRITA